jgi:hypothetical protein
MENWLKDELSYIELGDKRLNQRFGKLLRQLSQMPCSSIPEACGSKAATKAAYRFFDTERVAVKDIQEGFFQATNDRVKTYPVVLVVQDTTDLDFSTHTSTRGLGYLDNRWCQGLKVHSALAIGPDGVPLGLVDQQIWARDEKEYGKKHVCRKKKTSEKESQRWLTGVTKAERHIEESVSLVTIADREADMYDLFKQKRRRGHDVLIRATHNRALRDEPKLLYEKVVEAPMRGETEITIRRGRERKGRQAQIIIHWAAVEIQPPGHRAKEHLPSIRLNAIVAEEIHAPHGIAPVRWLLLTTRGVENFEDALQCVQWYTMRWLIERYHYTLKSGCQVEELQLEEAERIERAVAVYCIVAWRILFLTYLARLHPDQLSTTVLDTEEVEALSCFIRKSKEPLEKFPTIEEVVRMIAHLGGFLGRKGDGFPGVKVLWRGLRRLNDFFIAYQIFKDVGNA